MKQVIKLSYQPGINKRLWQGFTGNGYRDREVRRAIFVTDIHRTMSEARGRNGAFTMTSSTAR